jgi:hypothetical protein
MQSQIALSTMESEYNALSQSMRGLISIREIMKEVVLVDWDDIVTLLPTRHNRAATSSGWMSLTEHGVDHMCYHEDDLQYHCYL